MPNSEDKKLNFVAKVFDPVTQTYRPLYIAPDGTDTVQGDVFLSDDADETKTAANGMTAVTPAGLYKAINEYNPFKHQTVGSETVPVYMKDGQPEEITGLDASSIISGTISMDRLPQGAMERLVPVPDQAARFALTTKEVQLGDVVQQLDTQVMYVVVDESNLSNEKGYTQFSAGLATQLGTATVGDTQTSIYLNEGKPEVVNKVKAALVADRITTANIPDSTDLDTLTTANKYYSCQDNSIVKTLINCPTNEAFSLRVEYINAINNCFIQILTTYKGQMWFRTHNRQAFVTDWMQIYPADASTAIGILPVAHGGTGKTTLQEVVNELWLATPTTDNDLIDSNYIWYGNGTTNTPKRKTLAQLWSWAQPKVKVTKVDNAAYADKADSANSATTATSADTAKKANSATTADSSTYSIYLKYDTTISSTTDLNTMKGASYWNRTYKASGGNTVKNKPSGVDAFGLWVGRNADGWSYQLLVSSNKGNTVWYRTAADTGTLGAWLQIYPANLAAGTGIVATAHGGTGNAKGKAPTAGTADVANKLGTTSVGNTNTPIYLDNGTPKPISGSGSLDEKAVFLAAHPVGSYWWTSTNTNPNTAYGGKWTRIKDRFVWAMGDSDTVGSTGGAKTVTLTTAQMPSHTHSGPSHSHSLNSHTHSIPSHSHSLNSHTHSLNSHTHSISHTHKIPTHTVMLSGSSGSYEIKGHAGTSSNVADSTAAASSTTSGAATGSTGASTGSTASGGSGTTGSASGSTGSSGTGATGSAGSGNAHENMPPYIAAYCWHRTA